MEMFKTALITGGAGYIGSHTNKILHECGYNTIILDNLSCGHREHVKWGTLVVGDISDTRLLDHIFSTYTIDIVIHFAASAYVGESITNPSKYYNNNVKNTLSLLDSMLLNNVRNILFSSTCSTYGNNNEILFEDSPQVPVNPYGKSKLMTEQIILDYEKAYGLNHVFLRYFNAAGADPDGIIGEWHDPETHLIPLLLDVACGIRESITVYGTDYPTPDGTCIRDYIHVTDLADAHQKAIEYLRESSPSTAFNIGCGKGYSVYEVITTVEKVIGKKIATIKGQRRIGDPPKLVADSSKVRNILRWTPRYCSLEHIVEHAWKWHQKKCKLYYE